jgi:hypothetical protein
LPRRIGNFSYFIAVRDNLITQRQALRR